MRNIIISFFLIIGVIACKEEELHRAYGENDGVAPGKVEIMSCEMIPGGAIINYTIPDDEDLMYVKACYTLDSGTKMEARTSAYDNKVTLEGFNDTNEKDVYLYCVDRYENVGEPVKYTFIPGVSPLKNAYETIDIVAAFGGVNITLENTDKGNLVVDILSKDSLEQWYSVQTEYTSSPKIKLSVRGFGPEERIFGVYLHDRWNNATDTVFATLNPMEEYQLDKGRFKQIILDNDVTIGGPLAWNLGMELMWDDRTSGDNICAHSIDFDSFPQWFTFDLGTTTKLSRYVYWCRQPNYWYVGGNMKKWEIYGRPDKPAQDGSWEGWTLLRECESIKPSGLPVGQQTNEDIEHATKGEEFEFEPTLPAVRYIRIKGLETFDNSCRITINEVTFYGQKTN